MDEPKNIEPCYGLSVVRESYLDCFSIDGWDTFIRVLTLRHDQYLTRRREADRQTLARQTEEDKKRELSGDD